MKSTALETAKKNLKVANTISFGYMTLAILFIVLTIFATTDHTQSLLWAFTSTFCAMYFTIRMFFYFDKVFEAQTAVIELAHNSK